MPSFKEGCVVVHRPTSLIFKVIRWDREDKLLLVRPIKLPSDSGPASKPRKRTRWVFEKAVDLVERTSGTTTTTTTTTAASANGSASGGAPGRNRLPPATDHNLTKYARRSAKLDHRVEIRNDRDHPERGRGLFAVQRVPEGTEVMRVRAVGAALVRPSKQNVCSRCFQRTQEIDALTACRNCLLPLCDACRVGDAGDRPHSTMCEFARETMMFTVNPAVDEGILRLSADILARKKADEIEDADWDLLNSLESDDNEAGSIGLGARQRRKGVKIFKDAMAMDVSEEDVQTMYRRVSRNVYLVSPGETKVGFGDVLALFPLGALVNHSCRPNSCFHSMTKSSPRGPQVEVVLRSTFEVRAGDELCISYFPAFVETPVARRREMLSEYGFQCACARCQLEAEEEKHPEKHRKPRDQEAAKVLGRITEIEQGGRKPLQLGQEENSALEEALYLLSVTSEEDISSTLRCRLTMVALAVTIYSKGKRDAVRSLSAYSVACQHLAAFRDPRIVDLLLKLHANAVMLSRASEDTLHRMRMLMVAEDALAKAIEMCELCYGKRHDQSVVLHTLKNSRVRSRLPS